MFNRNAHHNRFPRLIAILLTLVLALLSTSLVFAALYDLSTTDGDVLDWNPVAVFQTDLSGDSVDGRADEDIINTWVGSGPAAGPSSVLFFHIQTAGGVESLDLAGRGVAASLDCDRDGNFDEKGDRKIVFLPNADILYVYQGDRSSFFQPTSPFPNGEMGQQWDTTGPIDRLEWKVALANIPPSTTISDDPPGANCQGQVDILFATFQFNTTPPFAFIKNLDTATARGFNVPTAVEVTRFNATSNGSNIFLAGSLILIGLSIVVGSVWLLRRVKA